MQGCRDVGERAASKTQHSQSRVRTNEEAGGETPDVRQI
jgi:hypothetical protein